MTIKTGMIKHNDSNVVVNIIHEGHKKCRVSFKYLPYKESFIRHKKDVNLLFGATWNHKLYEGNLK